MNLIDDHPNISMEHSDDDVLFTASSTSSPARTVVLRHPPGLHQNFEIEAVESTKKKKKMMMNSGTTITKGDTDAFFDNHSNRKNCNENHHRNDVNSVVKTYLAVKRVRSERELSSSSSSPSSLLSSRPTKMIRHSTERSNDDNAITTAGGGSKPFSSGNESPPLQNELESLRRHHHPHSLALGKELRDHVEEDTDIARREEITYPARCIAHNSNNLGRVVRDVICLLDSDDDDDDDDVSSLPRDGEPTIERRAPVKKFHDFDTRSFNNLNQGLGDDDGRKDDNDDDVMELGTKSAVANHTALEKNVAHPLGVNDNLVHNLKDDGISLEEGERSSIIKEPCAKATSCSPSQDVSRISSPAIAQPSRVRYPVGCPVWFNIQYSIPCSKYLMADKGIVRSVFVNNEKKIMYRLEKQSITSTTKLKPSVSSVSIKEEEDIAFAIHCPILVKVDDGTSSDTVDGEIINIRPVIDNKLGSRKTLYTVLLNSKEGDGGVKVEDNVQPDRISYRLSLHVIQSRLRLVDASSSRHENCKVAIGIRSDERGQPRRNKTPPQQLLLLPPLPKKVATKQYSYAIQQTTSKVMATTTTCDDNIVEYDDIDSSSVDDDNSLVDEEV